MADLATLYCPLVLQHAAAESSLPLDDTTYQVDDSTKTTVLYDVVAERREILRLTVSGPARGPIAVAVAYPIGGAGADTVNGVCSQRIFAAIDDLVTRLHIGDSTVLASQLVTLGPEPTTFTVPGGIPASGPRMTLTVAIAPPVREELRVNHTPGQHGAALYTRDGTEVLVQAVSISSDGTRRALQAGGFEGNGVLLGDEVPLKPGARVDRVVISANVPVQASKIIWWSGDPSKQIIWP